MAWFKTILDRAPVLYCLSGHGVVIGDQEMRQGWGQINERICKTSLDGVHNLNPTNSSFSYASQVTNPRAGSAIWECVWTMLNGMAREPGGFYVIWSSPIRESSCQNPGIQLTFCPQSSLWPWPLIPWFFISRIFCHFPTLISSSVPLLDLVELHSTWFISKLAKHILMLAFNKVLLGALAWCFLKTM